MNKEKQQEKQNFQTGNQMYQGYQTEFQNRQGNFNLQYDERKKSNYKEPRAKEEQYGLSLSRSDKF